MARSVYQNMIQSEFLTSFSLEIASPLPGFQAPRLPGLTFLPTSNVHCAKLHSTSQMTPILLEPTPAMSKPISAAAEVYMASQLRHGKGQGLSTLHKAPEQNVCDILWASDPTKSFTLTCPVTDRYMQWPWHTTPTAARTVVKRLLQHLWERRGGQKRISLGHARYQKVPTRTMKLVTPLQYSSCQVEVLRWIQTGVELRLRISCQIWSTNVRLKTSFSNFGYPELVGIVWSPAWCHMACQCPSANSLPKACCRDLNMAECCCCHYPLIILITW